MCKHLTTYKLERRLASIVLLLERQTTYTLMAKPKLIVNYIREYRPTTYRVKSDPALTSPQALLSAPRAALKTLVLES